jgi:hypothetical protein
VDVRKRSRTSIGKQEDGDKYAPGETYEDIFEEEDPADEAVELEVAMKEANEWTADAYNEYLLVEVMLPRNGEQFLGTVKYRSKDDDGGNPVGKQAQNPILDTHDYEVKFPNGSTDIYLTFLMAESFFSQIDGEQGRQYQLLSKIMDHCSDNTVILMIKYGHWVDKLVGQK